MNASLNSRNEDINALLQRIKETKARASLRSEGSAKLLGDLQVQALEQGKALHLAGAKRRDQLPPVGSPASLTVILGDEVLTVRSTILEPIISTDGDTLFPPVLRISWPTESFTVHQRRDVRVATPDLPPLRATLHVQGKRVEAKLLNLTELGVGLGIAEVVHLDLHSTARIETLLPGGIPFRSMGEVRHLERLQDESLPMRVGLVLVDIETPAREALNRFLQARRTDRSENMRQAFFGPRWQKSNL